MSAFELEAIGGPWARPIEAMPDLDAAAREASPEAREAARWVWTQSAFSEIASAAAFAAIASRLLACGAPIDLVAAAGDFVRDEVTHAELSARVANAMGGAVALDVDRSRLVRPALSADPLLAALELVVRTSCVGEALTVSILKTSKARAGSPAIEAVIARILRDEARHAALGWWTLDWAAPRLDDRARQHLGMVARHAVDAFAPLFQACDHDDGLGVLACDAYDAAFAHALERRVLAPLAARGITAKTSAPRRARGAPSPASPASARSR